MPFETPLAENPAPVVVTLEIVMFELPVLVRVTFCELFDPTCMLGNVTLDGLVPNESVAATPVPESGIASGEPGALLAREIEPFTDPVELGAKATLKVVFCPALIETGGVSPEMLKPVPVTVAEDIVRVAVPPFVIFTGVVFVIPVVTLPKATDVGFAEI